MKKQQTLLLLLLALVCAICFAFALTACGDNNTNEIDLTPAEGLEYTLFQGTDPYYACTGIGTAEETDIVIAKEYEGLPVTAIYHSAFMECTNIKSIHIPNSVKLIDTMAFAFCTSLENINIPNSVWLIGGGAFNGCTSLKNITIPNSVESIIGNTFAGCTSLERITVASGNKNYYSEGNCLIEKDSKTLIAGCKNSIIPSNITSIGNAAFFECTSLSNITIPNSVTFIGNNAFYNCTNLASINIPNSVTEIAGGAFYNCTSLKSITIPDSITSIGYCTFGNCTSLTTINFEGTVEQWNSIEKAYDWNLETDEYTIYCTDAEIAKDGTVVMY